MFATKCNPVSSDAKSNLDIFVFNDGRSCEDLESAAFGRNPYSCSGIYWEGDPRDAHEPARFVATEYTPDESPLYPKLAIWNFEHEYAHYLDGRYNRYGPYRGDDPSIHWWTEGFAEYFAAEVSPHFRLPDFQTPYSLTDTLLYSGSIPTRYAHRHLAVRYLIENHREFVDRLLEFMRHGEYAEYTALMQTEAPKYEAGWQSWLRSGGSAKAPDKVIDISVKPGINQLAVFWRPTNGASGYKVQWLSGTENFAFASQHMVGGGVISSHVIRGLKPGVQYAVRIIATRNYADDGPPSKIETGKPISDTLELLSEEEEASFDLPALFAAEGEMLAYAVEDSPQTLVAARIDGNQLVISPNEYGEEGVAIVTVTATAPDGFTMQLFFRVAVEPMAHMLRGWRYWLLDPDKRD